MPGQKNCINPIMSRLESVIHYSSIVFLLAAICPGLCFADEIPGRAAVLKFENYSSAAATDEIIRRVMSPVSVDRIQNHYKKSGEKLPQQSILLEKESFDFYLPVGEPPAVGYGLIVFIAPFDIAEIPFEWRKLFDRSGIIYVAARRSGNDHNMMGRRIPLALHAYENVAKRYRLNPERVYISGFSGGSRTAMRVALSYPDIFRGAIFNAGSDPFGNTGITIPPPELFNLFQNRTRMVQVTGAEDDLVEIIDGRMRKSAHDLCVRNLVSQPMRKTGHALMSAESLQRALSTIESSWPESGNYEQCNARIRMEIDAGLNQAQELIDKGLKQKAGQQLSTIDYQYGGLATPRSIELARKIVSMENTK